jgi:GNAT superfamily N-acetyltransferase
MTARLQNMNDYKLDNPVWYSLSETHQRFAVEYPYVKFYHPDYCPFGGFQKLEHTADGIAAYSSLTDSFFVVGEKADVPNHLAIKKEMICAQMILQHKQQVEKQEEIIPLGIELRPALFELVNLVQPGYFRESTAALGDYFGIFKDGKLVAVTGERMQMDDFVEVSAVVTHPDHIGKGYAKQLVDHGVNNILQKSKIPYLHVVESNATAIGLYEKLGFKTRRKISFWHIMRGVF